MIKVLDKQMIDERIKIMNKILLHFTAEKHKMFVKAHNLQPNLNPFKHKTWHSDFNLDTIEDVPLFCLITSTSTQRGR